MYLELHHFQLKLKKKFNFDQKKKKIQKEQIPRTVFKSPEEDAAWIGLILSSLLENVISAPALINVLTIL